MDRLTSVLAIPVLIGATLVQCGGSDESHPANYDANGGSLGNPVGVRPGIEAGTGTPGSSTNVATSGGAGQGFSGDAAGALGAGGVGALGVDFGQGGAATFGAGGAMPFGAGGAATFGAGGAMPFGAGGAMPFGAGGAAETSPLGAT